mgnify:CR=1 FL=1
MNSRNPILSVSNLHKRYDSTYNINPINLAIKEIFNLKRISSRNLKYEALDYFALKNINLNIFPGQIIGIIGRNGSGKSTFLKLLAGLISPTIGALPLLQSIHWYAATVCVAVKVAPFCVKLISGLGLIIKSRVIILSQPAAFVVV